MAKKLGIPKIKTKTKANVQTKRQPSKPAPDVLTKKPNIVMSKFESQRDEERVISPTEAKKMTQKSNMYWEMRGVTPSRVNNYSQLMNQGYWMPGLTISMAVFNGRTYLIDGQHRMLALIEHGKPIRFNVKHYECRSKEQVEHLYQILDQGKSKTKLETMISAGSGKTLEITKTRLARATSAVSMIYRKFGRANELEGEAWQFANNPLMQSHILIEGWGDAIRGYYDAIHGSMKEMTRASGNLNRSGCVAVGLLTFRADPVKAFKFWHGVGRFHTLEEDDPRFTAGRYIMATDMKREGGTPQHKHARAILSCWNAYAQNRTLSRIMVVEKFTTKVFGFDYEI